MAGATVWFNASCSKCRTTHGILQERGVSTDLVDYLGRTPDREEIERVMKLLGVTHAREIARQGEQAWTELGLADASSAEVIDAMLEHPILIERPIVIVGDRAVIARPPERVLELLG